MSEIDHLNIDNIRICLEAEAENMRLSDNKDFALESTILRRWQDIAKSQAVAVASTPFVHRDCQVIFDPIVPIEGRKIFRPIKKLIRQLVYWYINFLSIQANTFAAELMQHLRATETQLQQAYKRIEYLLQTSARFGPVSLIEPDISFEVSPNIASKIADIVGQSYCVVISGGTGNIVEAIEKKGGSALGIEPIADYTILALQRRLDIRHGEVFSELQILPDQSIDTLVLTGIIDLLPRRKNEELIIEAKRLLKVNGRVIVAAMNPTSRTIAESEITSGLGISTYTWAHLLKKAGFITQLIPLYETNITELVVGNISSVQQGKPLIYKSKKTSTQTVDLILPELSKGDATSNHTQLLQELLHKKGITTRVIVERRYIAEPNILTLEEWPADANINILQHSIGSQTAQYIIEKQLPIILNYHNITPSKFFESWYPALAQSAERGRKQISQLAPLVIRAIADSEFNSQELKELGIADVKVSPVLWSMTRIQSEFHHTDTTIPEDGGIILFVGRIAPNKCHHDLISAFASLSSHRPKARLVIVGEASPVRYLHSLENLAKDLGVGSRVIFTGKVSEGTLLQCYESADVFASASEHEGFGVPLVEAMAKGVPVVAYNAAAVGETLGGAGLLLSDKRPLTMASAIDRVLGDQELRSTLRERGFVSAERFDISVTREQMWKSLEDLLDIQ